MKIIIRIVQRGNVEKREFYANNETEIFSRG